MFEITFEMTIEIDLSVVLSGSGHLLTSLVVPSGSKISRIRGSVVLWVPSVILGHCFPKVRGLDFQMFYGVQTDGTRTLTKESLINDKKRQFFGS